MGVPIARLYNFVTDKNNGTPITASRVDAELDQLIAGLNKVGISQSSAPSSPTEGDLWFDTTNDILKVFRNNEWVTQGIVQVSVSAPASPQEGDIWWDKTNNILYVYNSSAWIRIATDSQGVDVASATTITLGDGNVFKITGTTGITNITIKPAGFTAKLYFADILSITNSGNIILNNGSFTTVSNSTMTLISDGTYWYETCRSPQAASLVGALADKSSGYGAQQATTDGFIEVVLTATGTSDLIVNCYTDSAADPTTNVSGIKVNANYINNGDKQSLFMVVKKNDYWKVVVTSGVTSIKVYWVPLGA